MEINHLQNFYNVVIMLLLQVELQFIKLPAMGDPLITGPTGKISGKFSIPDPKRIWKSCFQSWRESSQINF